MQLISDEVMRERWMEGGMDEWMARVKYIHTMVWHSFSKENILGVAYEHTVDF